MQKNDKERTTLQKFKPWLLTVMYLAILIALYLIYGTGDTHNNFIYNEF
ncbi:MULTISPECIES: teichoic acid D-Ala incorporation-associated protein DltX [Staphylococcus]|nr:teichoic acid D-Ala incorporation-associated protein DltX [Staphylococcus sp. GDH8C109P]